MRIALAAASLLLVAGGAAACGDDGGGKGSKASDGGGAADKGVSTEDFCGAFQDFSDDLEGVTGTEENLGEILKKAAQRIEDVGTPDDIPDDAKEGLQLTLDAIDGLPDDASAADMMSDIGADFTDEEQKSVDAFGDYLDKTCPDIDGSGDTDTDSGSESGSSDPSDSGDGS